MQLHRLSSKVSSSSGGSMNAPSTQASDHLSLDGSRYSNSSLRAS